MKQSDIKVIQYGLGEIGRSITKLLLSKKKIKIVGAIDLDKSIVGKYLGEVVDHGKPIKVAVSDNTREVFRKNKDADVVIHATRSSLKEVYPQIEEAVKAGFNVVSTCEELAFPCGRNTGLGEKLDKLAKKHGVVVLGTGVNPGFMMDSLPITMTGVCKEVRRIRVTRIVDASQRRFQLQRKVGAGLTPEEFQERVEEKKIRHVGLTESAAMIADALGWKLNKIREEINPVIATRDIRTQYLEVEAGNVAGVKQTVYGIKDGAEAIILELQMYVGAENPRDSIYIEGIPDIDMTIDNGINGDIATTAIVVNSLNRVLDAEPGLKTMKDLPAPFYSSRW